MLQKLENVYLGILRGVVLIASGCLLLAAIFFGFNALKVISGPPSFDPYTPSIESAADDKESLIERFQPQEDSPQKAQESTSGNLSTSSQETTVEDPNQAHYEEVASLVDEFVTEVTGQPDGVNLSFVINHVRSRAEAYSAADLTNAYASDIVPYVRNMLLDESVTDVANSQNMFDIVDEVLNNFDQQFDQALDAEDRRRNQAHRQHVQDKVEGMQSLYIAGGTFGSFLFIVFLSIFIKIERNLRYLAPGQQKTAEKS